MKKKTHQLVDGRLLQMNKRFSDLKMGQREQIAQWLFEEHSRIAQESEPPIHRQWDMRIVDAVYKKVEAAGIWIPCDEILKYYQGKKTAFQKRLGRACKES